MRKTNETQKVTQARRRAQPSTAMSRRTVKRPTRISDKQSEAMSTAKSPKIQRFSEQFADAKMQSSDKGLTTKAIERRAIKVQPEMPQMQSKMSQIQSEVSREMHPIHQKANAKMQKMAMEKAEKTADAPKMTAKQLKDQAIKKALAVAAMAPEADQTTDAQKQKKKTSSKMRFGVGRVVLAMSCAAAVVFAIAYFVNLNMPDVSLRVAAMQTGINASYPSYVPRGYSVSSITSESGQVTIDFENKDEGSSFSLSEETSSWDSNALETNFVKTEFGDNYNVIREQGLTIFISGSSAAWANGGNVYKLTADNGTLTNKQIRSIAVSL